MNNDICRCMCKTLAPIKNARTSIWTLAFISTNTFDGPPLITKAKQQTSSLESRVRLSVQFPFVCKQTYCAFSEAVFHSTLNGFSRQPEYDSLHFKKLHQPLTRIIVPPASQYFTYHCWRSKVLLINYLSSLYLHTTSPPVTGGFS